MYQNFYLLFSAIFLFSAIIAPKQRIYPRRQTQLTYYRCALLYIFHQNDEPPGTAYVAIPGGSIGRLNRYNPFRPYQNNFICVSVRTATTASTSFSQRSNVANFSGVGFRWQRRWLCRICFTISANSFAVISSGFSICGALSSSAILLPIQTK